MGGSCISEGLGGKKIDDIIKHGLGSSQIYGDSCDLVAHKASSTHLHHAGEGSWDDQRVLIRNKYIFENQSISGSGSKPNGIHLL